MSEKIIDVGAETAQKIADIAADSVVEKLLTDKNIRLDSQQMETLAQVAARHIKFNIDYDKICSNVLKKVFRTDEQEDLLYTRKIRADVIDDVVKRIPPPRDGDTYVLTAQDKIDIAGIIRRVLPQDIAEIVKNADFVSDADLTRRLNNVAQILRERTGKKVITAGFSGREIIAEIDRALGTDTWRKNNGDMLKSTYDQNDDGEIDAGAFDDSHLVLKDNAEIGSGSPGVDYKITFKGESSEGELQWFEDEQKFRLGNGTDYIEFDVDGSIIECNISKNELNIKTLLTDTRTTLNVLGSGAANARIQTTRGDDGNAFLRWEQTATSIQFDFGTSIDNFYINTQKADVDFIVRGTTDDNVLKVDAGSNNVGIGVSGVPGAKLEVNGSAKITSLTAGFIKADGSGILSTEPIPFTPGFAKGFVAKYASSTFVNITGGWYEANGKLYVLGQTGANYTVASLAAGFDFHYIYIDDSASTPPTPTFTDSTAQPLWNALKQGWYNGDDRLVDVVPSTSGASTIYRFNTRVINDNLIRHELPGYRNNFQLAFNLNPNGTWQTPTTESSVYVPVNAVEACIFMKGADIVPAPLFITWLDNESAALSSDIRDSVMLMNGYDSQVFTKWGYLGPSRNIKIAGDDDDSNQLSASVAGYGYTR